MTEHSLPREPIELRATGPHIRAVRSLAQRLEPGNPHEYDAIIDLIGDAPFVFLGEATHGTHEFYAIRQQLTKRLIEEKGFQAICIEGVCP